ncbi:MAG: Imm1 family immunity protein [Rhizonema sp. NSF051]|nr:Imm1 family immunity protein [Rhizonema sp. NSF051]
MGQQERGNTDNRIESFIKNIVNPTPPIDPNWIYATAWEKCNEASRMMLRISGMMSVARAEDTGAVAEELREAIALLQQAERSLTKQAMFVNYFSTEDWRRNRNYGTTAKPNNWKDIESAILDLDGDRRTLVTLEGDGDIEMGIGGDDTVYVVYLTFDGEAFQYLIDPSKTAFEQPKSLTIGGQEATYARNCCVDLEMALKAAKTFAEKGTIDASLSWELD